MKLSLRDKIAADRVDRKWNEELQKDYAEMRGEEIPIQPIQTTHQIPTFEERKKALILTPIETYTLKNKNIVKIFEEAGKNFYQVFNPGSMTPIYDSRKSTEGSSKTRRIILAIIVAKEKSKKVEV